MEIMAGNLRRHVLGRGGFSTGWRALLLFALVAGPLGLGAAVAAGPAPATRHAALPDLTELQQRAQAAQAALDGVETFYAWEIAPIERVLLQHRNDPQLAHRIALALVREAASVRIEPRVLLAVLLVENPWLDPSAESFVGARGLMQVMPMHDGKWSGCTGSLDEIEPNICYGSRIFAHYYRATGGDIERALLRYNGCVRGTNTPDCHRYPYHVYARAGRASIQAWLGIKPEPLSTVTRAAAP
jgi:soluble lytic murein transglycosylase-like protein